MSRHLQATSSWPTPARSLAKGNPGEDPLGELRQRITAATSQRRPVARAAVGPETGWALDRLDETYEELQTADEELKVQAEQIHEIERALDGERQRYRELFDFAPEPSLVTDENGKILAANRAAVEMLDVRSHGLVGRLLASFVRVADRPTFRERLSAASRRGVTSRWDCALGLPPGRPVLELIASVAAGPDGRGGVLWSMRDTTERSQHEARVRALNDELERRVLERTRELEVSRRIFEELLVREREMRRQAEADSREKDTLVALVSHDLRSPLQVVLGWMQMARAEATLPSEPLAAIERSTHTMLMLVGDLIERAHLERGALRLDKERLGLASHLATLCRLLQPVAQGRGLSLRFACEVPDPPIDADPGRLDQAFGNLLANAMKFTPPGGTIDVRVAVEAEQAVARVTDSGRGILPERLPDLFEGKPPEVTPESRQGLGLGLSIVRHIVEAHGGQVRGESAGVGFGATFVVRLPLAADG